MKRTIVCDFDYIGLHHYPDAKGDFKFLANPHRHTFRIRALYFVKHNDREIEIFEQERKMLIYLQESFNGDFGIMSCESIAQNLLQTFVMNGCYQVEVYEDSRGGAIVSI